jgi:hypothetical protein
MVWRQPQQKTRHSYPFISGEEMFDRLFFRSYVQYGYSWSGFWSEKSIPN